MNVAEKTTNSMLDSPKILRLTDNLLLCTNLAIRNETNNTILHATLDK